MEPPPSRWVFPNDPAALAATAGDGEVVGMGADLEPGTLLAAYRSGLFPDAGPTTADGVVVTRSAGRSCPLDAGGRAAGELDRCGNRAGDSRSG